jgi:hypothetical protein
MLQICVADDRGSMRRRRRAVGLVTAKGRLSPVAGQLEGEQRSLPQGRSQHRINPGAQLKKYI